MELEILLHLLRKINQVPFIIFWKNDLFDSGSMSGNDLFSNSANLQSTTAKSDFSSHGEVSLDRSVSKGGDYSSSYGQTGTGTVFGNSSFRNVDMNIRFGDFFLFYPQLDTV